MEAIDISPVSLTEFYKDMCNNDNTFDYAHRVFTMLDKLPQGESIIIDNVVKTENKMMFLKSVCIYINWYKMFDYVLSKDYSKVIRFSN